MRFCIELTLTGTPLNRFSNVNAGLHSLSISLLTIYSCRTLFFGHVHTLAISPNIFYGLIGHLSWCCPTIYSQTFALLKQPYSLPHISLAHPFHHHHQCGLLYFGGQPVPLVFFDIYDPCLVCVSTDQAFSRCIQG